MTGIIIIYIAVPPWNSNILHRHHSNTHGKKFSKPQELNRWVRKQREEGYSFCMGANNASLLSQISFISQPSICFSKSWRIQRCKELPVHSVKGQEELQPLQARQLPRARQGSRVRSSPAVGLGGLCPGQAAATSVSPAPAPALLCAPSTCCPCTSQPGTKGRLRIHFLLHQLGLNKTKQKQTNTAPLNA